METDKNWMQHAFDCALQAEASGEVPVGAVLVLDETLQASGFNQVIQLSDPTAHAEIVALRAFCEKQGNYRLPPGMTLYVTLEPCAMCLGALFHARLSRLVFATPDPKTGAVCSVAKLTELPINHHLTWESGVLQTQVSEHLKAFFKQKR